MSNHFRPVQPATQSSMSLFSTTSRSSFSGTSYASGLSFSLPSFSLPSFSLGAR